MALGFFGVAFARGGGRVARMDSPPSSGKASVVGRKHDNLPDMSRSGLISTFLVMTIFVMTILLAPAARSQDAAPPPVGGVISPPDAMIFYLAHGRDGACGQNCSEWIAAEGVVEWDTFKRLFAFAARLGERKVPVILNVGGQSDLKVAMSLGKIIRDRGLDVSAGRTVVAECAEAAEAACIALKRGGKSLDAGIDISAVECDIVCLLILTGGVHRMLPAGAKVLVGPTQVRSRFAPNVSDEQQKGLQAFFDD